MNVHDYLWLLKQSKAPSILATALAFAAHITLVSCLCTQPGHRRSQQNTCNHSPLPLSPASPPWPCSVCSQLPSYMLHTLTVPSSLAVTQRMP